MEVQVEVTPHVFNDEIEALQGLQEKLQDALENVLGLRVKVSLVEPRSLQRSEGKAKRVIDRRTS
jgi:phenylacetate-CoA ligase